MNGSDNYSLLLAGNTMPIIEINPNDMVVFNSYCQTSGWNPSVSSGERPPAGPGG